MKTTKDIKEYEVYLYRKELAKGTISIYVRQAEALLNYMQTGSLTKEKMIEYKKYIEERKLAVSTQNLHITAVNSYLRYSGHKECVIKTKRVQRRSIDNVISLAEYKQMLAYAKESGREKYYHIMRTMALTGIRVSELKYFTVEVLDQYRITVNSKGKVREIYLPEEAAKGMKSYCLQEKIVSGPVFQGKKGEPISRVAVYRMLIRMADMLGIPKEKVHPHSFRHLFALTYMEHYGNLAELSDLLGHSSMETTRIYTVTSVQEKRDRLNKLGL